MNDFTYHTPTRVYFGKGKENEVGRIISECGAKKVLIVYGGGSAEKSGLLARVRGSLKESGIDFAELGGVKPNPELPLVREGIGLCQKEGVDFVLAVGGGSVLDTTKDIANGLANPDVDVWDFSIKKSAPKATTKKGAILTIAAAGSEMSDSCVISNPDTGIKSGYNTEKNRMDFTIMNPELTYSVSPYQTACGAVDIAMHTMERYFCEGEETYLTDGIAEAIIKTAIRSGRDALADPKNYEARANMMWASSLAHNGLTACGRDVKTMAVHQLEHAVSGMYPKVAHGAGLAALWCSWARYVCAAMPERFIKFAGNVWNIDIDHDDPEYTITRAIDMQENYYREIGMPTSLRELEIKEDDLPKLADICSMGKTRTLPGYRPLSHDDMLAIYRMAF